MKFATLACLLLLPTLAFTQQKLPQEVRYRAIAEAFIANYNKHDYEAMREPMVKILKLMLPKKTWQNLWASKQEKYGQMTVGPADIDVSNGYAAIKLKYAKDTTYKEQINFYFDKNDKIAGARFKPDYYYFTAPTAPISNYEPVVDSILAADFPKGFNGTVLFSKDSKVLFHKNYGYNNLSTREPVNDSSVFELASCSKQFTAAAILKLQEMGKLSVNDSIQAFFPLLHAFPGVRIHHLLHHTGGLPDYMGPLASTKWKKPYCFNEDVINWLGSKKLKPEFAPGNKYEYSNTGYVVLASIIEKVSGMSYADFLKQQFFLPLGMTHTRVYNTRRTGGEIIPNYAYGYVYTRKDKSFHLPDRLKDYRYVIKLDGITGDGTVNTTAPDLIKWSNGLNQHRVLSASSLDSAYTEGRLNNGRKTDYGYGVEVQRRDNAGLIIAHTGGWPGYQTIIYRFPDSGKMLVILSTKEYEDNDLVGAARRITSLFINQ